MLSVPGLFPGDVPIRHPAELLPFNALQHDQEGVRRHLLFLFSQPGFQLVRKECRNRFEFAIAAPELEIDAESQFARAAASRAILRRCSRELVEAVEERLMGRVFLVTLIAVEALGRHGGTVLSWDPGAAARLC